MSILIIKTVYSKQYIQNSIFSKKKTNLFRRPIYFIKILFYYWAMSNKRKKIEGLGRVVLVLSCLVGMEKTRAAVAFTPDVDYAARAVPDLPAFPAGIRPLPVDMGQRAAPAPLVAAVPAAGSAVEAITNRLAQTRILGEVRAGAIADAICGAVIRLIGEGLAAMPATAGDIRNYYESFTDAGGAATANMTAVRDMIQAALLDGVTAEDAGFVRAVMTTARAATSADGPDAAAINAVAAGDDNRSFDPVATLNALVGNNPATGAPYTAAQARDFARQVATESTQNNRYYMLQALELLSGVNVIAYVNGAAEPAVGGIFPLAAGAEVAENIAKISKTIFRDFNSGNRFVSHIKEAMRDANPRTGIWNRLIGVAQNRFTGGNIAGLTSGLNKDTNNTEASLQVQKFTTQILTDMVDGLGGYIGSIQNDFKTIANVGWAAADVAPAGTPEHIASQQITAFINTITVDSIRSVINKLKDSTDKSERDKIIKALVALEKAVSLNAIFAVIPNGAMANPGFAAQANLAVEYANYMNANHADPKSSTDIANRLQALEAHLKPAAQPGAAAVQPGGAPAQPDKRPRAFPRRSIIGAGRRFDSRRGRPMLRRGRRFIGSRGFGRQGSRTQFQFQSRGSSRTQFQFQPRGRSNSTLPSNWL